MSHRTRRIVCSPCASPPALPSSPSCRFVPQRAIRNTMPRPSPFGFSSASTRQVDTATQIQFLRCSLRSVAADGGRAGVQASTTSRWLSSFASARLSICGSMQNDASLRRHPAAIALSILHTKRLCTPGTPLKPFQLWTQLPARHAEPLPARPRRGLCIGRRCTALRHDA